VHDEKENGGLFASQKVLLDAYAEVMLPNKDSTETPVNKVLSFADFSAWAAHAALIRSAQAVVGVADRVQCPDPDGVNGCDIVPEIPVRWGRKSYLNATETDEGPIEIFPGDGPSGSGEAVVAYFHREFSLTERETVTLMGVHTFGGARRVDSGYASCRNSYQRQLIFPLPVSCIVNDDETQDCEYFSQAGADITDYEGMKSCLSGHEGRCLGWEQQRMKAVQGSGNPDKFQWRHSFATRMTKRMASLEH